MSSDRLPLPPASFDKRPFVELWLDRSTRAWAAALYAAVNDADGMIWVSRQHDTSAAILLFGTRIDRNELEVIEAPRPLAPHGRIDAAVSVAAEAAGITLVPSL